MNPTHSTDRKNTLKTVKITYTRTKKQGIVLEHITEWLSESEAQTFKNMLMRIRSRNSEFED